MKNTILLILSYTLRSFLYAFLLLGLVGAGLSSCATIHSAGVQKHSKRYDQSPPVDAFAFVITKTVVKPSHCMPSKEIETCKQVIKKLPIINTGGYGSGMLIRSKGGPIVLTAHHVCEGSPDKMIYEKEGVKIKLSAQTHVEIRVSTGETIPAKMIKKDEARDLCALRPSKIYTSPVEWSPIAPKVGDKVMAISAPLGINHPDMNLVFGGYYSGVIGIFHHYTIPSRPGSSGSIVLNKNFKGVGMINAAYIRFESIGMGAGHEDIRKFLESI